MPVKLRREEARGALIEMMRDTLAYYVRDEVIEEFGEVPTVELMVELWMRFAMDTGYVFEVDITITDDKGFVLQVRKGCMFRFTTAEGELRELGFGGSFISD